MKLPKNDPLFEGFDLRSLFESRLPSADIFKAGGIDAYLDSIVRNETLVLRQTQNFANIARYSFGITATTQGVLDVKLDDLRKLFDSEINLGDVRTALEVAGKLVGALSSLDSAIRGLGSAVPVFGIVINLAIGVVDWFKMVIDAGKKEGPKFGQQARTYSRAIDEEITRGIIDEGRLTDWTNIFLPTSTAPWQANPAAYTDTGQPDGTFIEPGGRFVDIEGRGIVPLLTAQFGAYQYPKRLPGSTRKAGRESIVGYTELHPSSVQAGLLWSQRIMKPSPEMFWIDPNKIVSKWRDYFGEGEELLNRSDDSQLRDQLRVILSFANERDGWQRFTKYSATSVPAEAQRGAVDGYLQLAELVEYLVLRKWRARATAALGTTIVAYVDPQSPAIRNDSWLRTVHRNMRKLLLEHKRRFDVQVNMIPDAAYRNEMWRATMRLDPQLKLKTDASGRPPKRFDGAPVIDPAEPDPPPDSDAEPAIPENLNPDKGGGAGAAVAGGALAVLALYGLTRLAR